MAFKIIIATILVILFYIHLYTPLLNYEPIFPIEFILYLLFLPIAIFLSFKIVRKIAGLTFKEIRKKSLRRWLLLLFVTIIIPLLIMHYIYNAIGWLNYYVAKDKFSMNMEIKQAYCLSYSSKHKAIQSNFLELITVDENGEPYTLRFSYPACQNYQQPLNNLQNKKIIVTGRRSYLGVIYDNFKVQ